MSEIRESDLENRRNMILELVKSGDNYDTECNELLEFAIILQAHEYIAFAYIYKTLYEVRNDYSVVGECLIRASEYLDFKKPSRPLQLYYNLYNTYHSYVNDTQTSVQDCLLGLQVSFELSDDVAVAVFYNNIGEVFFVHEDYDDAYTYFEKAYEVMKECESSRMNYKIAFLSNLGQSCLLSGRLQEALHYIEIIESENLSELNYRHELYMLCLLYYTSIEDYENAMRHYDLLLKEHFKIDRNKALTFDYLLVMCQSMIHFHKQKECENILELLKSCEDELIKSVKVQKIKITYYKEFGLIEQMKEQYKKNYDNYIAFEKQNNVMKVNSLQLKLRLAKTLNENIFVQKQVDKLENKVNHDDLTGLFNRKYLNILHMNLDREVGLNKVCFIMLDVDYFKEYNDTYGHMKGDRVLKMVAKCIQEVTKDNLYGFRYGGDEFACLCLNMDNAEIETILEKIRDKLATYNIMHSHSLCSSNVTLSIGYSNESYDASMDMYALFDKADQALYMSKENGRNRYTCYR